MSEQTAELHCATGSVVARVGQRFTDPYRQGVEWEIAGFTDDLHFSADAPGKRWPNVRLRIAAGRPSGLERYVDAEGFIVLCGDSVCADLLYHQDGRYRGARGHLLRADYTPPGAVA